MKITTLLILAALPFADAWLSERSRFQRERERLSRAARVAAAQGNRRRGHVNEYPIRGIAVRQGGGIGGGGGIPPTGTTKGATPPTPTPTPTPSPPTSSSEPPSSAPPSSSPSSSAPPSSAPPSTTSTPPPPTSINTPSSAPPSSSSLPSTSQPVVTVSITDSVSSSASPTATAPPAEAPDNTSHKGTIIGLSVTGGIAVAAVIAFLIWKFRSKRFSDFEDDTGDAIKWPELNAADSSAMHPLPTRATGRAGIETNALDQSEFDSQSITGASNVDLHNPQNVNYGSNQYSQTAAYYDDAHGQGAGGAYYDPYQGPVPQSMADDHWGGAPPPPPGPGSVYGAAAGIPRTGTPGQESVYGARSRSPGPAAAYGRAPSPGPNVAYGARAASPGPGGAYGGAPGRVGSPGPNLAYSVGPGPGPGPGRTPSPGPNMAYGGGGGPGRTPSPGPNQAYGTYQ